MDIASLLKYMQDTEFSLFLGAGSSVPGGGPTSSQLLDEVRRRYPQANEENDFFRAFDLILSPDNKERARVEESLKSLLISIAPNEDHKYLFSLPWRAVLTTNYDRIPDLIDTTLDGNRVIFTLVGPEPRIDIQREEHLYCLKLFGDISFSYPHEGHPVLTNADRRRAYTRQAAFFRLFGDLAKSGIVVYLGYSFGDELVFDILNDLLFEVKNFPHRGFAVMPDKPTEAVLQKMKQYNIEWVKGTLDEFIVESKKIFGKTPKSCSIALYPLKVHGKIIDLDRATFSNIRGKLKIVHQGLFSSDYGDPKSFLEGKDKSFVPFQAGWDFPRKWKLVHNSEKAAPEWFEDVETLVKSRLETGNPADNFVYALIGAAGSGKSIVAARIAFEWYKNGNPVLFLEPTNIFIDTTALESLLDEIWNKYRKEIRPEEFKALRHLIICDNASLLLPQIIQLASHLMSAGKPVDILIVDRSSELPESLLKELGVDAVFTLKDTITDEERDEFLEHFGRIGVLPDTSTLGANLRNPEINASFFALMYTSIREVQVPIKDIITKEFESKTPEIKRLYAIVSLIQSYGLTPYYTLMTKSSNMDFQKIMTLMTSGPLKDVLAFNDEEESIQANHRVIADIINTYVFSTGDLLKNGLSTVISVVTDGNISEMTLVHKLLIDCGEIQRRLSPEQMEELFNVGAGRMATRPLLLHLARTQLKLKKWDECRVSLRYARKTQHPSFPEPLHHVLDVEGRLEVSLARESIMKGDEPAAWAHLEKAEGAFRQAKIDPISTPHPYLGLSQTYTEMSKLESDRHLRMNLCILSLDILKQLENNSPEWFTLNRALDLERELFQSLIAAGFDEGDALVLYERNRNANGYAFLAEKEAEIGNEEKALKLVDKGLELDPTSVWLIRVRVNVIKKLYPEDYDELYDVLMLYQRQKERFFDLQLAFELAKLQFIKGDWDLSKQTFSELRIKSRGYKYRLIPSERDRWFEKGEAKKLSGIVVKSPTIEEWGELSSSEPLIPYPIPVRHFDMKYEMYSRLDKVKFEIVFNMTGPQASNVTQR